MGGSFLVCPCIRAIINRVIFFHIVLFYFSSSFLMYSSLFWFAVIILSKVSS